MRVENQERPTNPIYNYALITDSIEGLILTNVNTLSDGEPRNNFLERAVTWNAGGVLDGAKYLSVGGHYAYISARAGLVIVDLDDPLNPKHVATVPMNDARGVYLQFRYAFVTDAEGLKVVDVTDPNNPKLTPNNVIKLSNANNLTLARTFAYVAAGSEGLIIVDVTNPENMIEYARLDDGLVDARDVVVASTNASLYAYVADGVGGLKVVQLTSPKSQPRYYGFSPDPVPEVIATFETEMPALSLSRALERDRAVDETGGQVAVFSRLGSGPLTEEDMRKLYLDKSGKPWFVKDELDTKQAEQK
jgi:hypothetical protein